MDDPFIDERPSGEEWARYWTRYFRDQVEAEADLLSLLPLPAPCGDCAVIGCLYMEHARELAKQPVDVRRAVLRTWNCHNATDRSCRGAWDVAMEGEAP